MSDSDYIFSAHANLLKIMLNDQINTVISNVRSDSLPAGMLRKNFKDTVRQFVVSDKTYSFIHLVRGTPSYSKRFNYILAWNYKHPISRNQTFTLENVNNYVVIPPTKDISSIK